MATDAEGNSSGKLGDSAVIDVAEVSRLLLFRQLTLLTKTAVLIR